MYMKDKNGKVIESFKLDDNFPSCGACQLDGGKEATTCQPAFMCNQTSGPGNCEFLLGKTCEPFNLGLIYKACKNADGMDCKQTTLYLPK